MQAKLWKVGVAFGLHVDSDATRFCSCIGPTKWDTSWDRWWDSQWHEICGSTWNRMGGYARERYMEYDTSFGRWLQQRRKALDLTRDTLGRCVGCASDTIRKIETDLRRPSRAMAERLAACLDIAESDRAGFLRFARGELSTRPPTSVRAPSAPLPWQTPAPFTAPRPLTTFVGRQAEVTAVVELLGRAHIRLLTLTGPGGIGKTRLAVEVAQRIRHQFAHGVVFIELATLTDPSLVLPTIARAFDITETPGEPLLDTLAAVLGDTNVLLVLDNFEHLLSAASTVAMLLGAAPHLTALVTSSGDLALAR